jgi:alkyldihydroxyacetonephosphate synthase
MSWSGWGDPARAMSLPLAVAGLLESALGVKPVRVEPVGLDEVRLPPPLTGPALAELVEVVGSGHVLVSAEDRVHRTRGKSTVDLLRIRAGDGTDAPGAVVLPGSHEEVLAVLAVCAAHRVAVVPFGGGTSVVGGLAPDRTGHGGVVSLDLARLDALVAVDEVSRTATFEAGVRAPDAERMLGERGFTLGHFPQSFEYATVGGFAATRSSGQYSAGYGRFDDLVMALRVATPAGTVEAGRAPRSAAGPDLRQLFLGSEGTLGVITSVTLRVQPAPAERIVEGWAFESFPDGVAALRTLAQDGPLPTMLRLSDGYESMVNAAISGGGPGSGGCAAIVGYEGAAGLRARDGATEVLTAAGGRPLGPEPGAAWSHGRFQAPYLRDALLGAGALAETLETATFWSGLPMLYDEVREALLTTLGEAGTPPLVLCHVSHVYPAGASLYFTVVCAQADDPVAQWHAAKRAANAAIVAAGGTITHHHAVGTDHAAALAEEIGPLAVEALRAVKQRLDPAGILNPGILMG